MMPGEIAVVNPGKQWTYAGQPYLSGDIESSRLDVAALGLTPLKLEERGLWTPDEHFWGEGKGPIGEWAKSIIARGPRPCFEMEQVVPGRDPRDCDSDPICESNDLKDAGDPEAARQMLMELCRTDLRCLDAHAHLGNLVFDSGPKEAIRHYQVGLRIGELSLGPDFDGVLPWGHIDNRPFLRCMHGLGPVPAAARSVRGSRTRARTNALAQPIGQSGCALPDRWRACQITRGQTTISRPPICKESCSVAYKCSCVLVFLCSCVLVFLCSWTFSAPRTARSTGSASGTFARRGLAGGCRPRWLLGQGADGNAAGRSGGHRGRRDTGRSP